MGVVHPERKEDLLLNVFGEVLAAILATAQWIRPPNGVILASMTDVTRILSQIESGDPTAATQLLPLVYEELRRLAAAKLAQEKPGQTLQATALVHEAWIQLVDSERQWNSRGHFFAAAAQAMRRILIDHARQKNRVKLGDGRERLELDFHCPATREAKPI